MSDLVGTPKDRLSRNEAHLDAAGFFTLNIFFFRYDIYMI